MDLKLQRSDLIQVDPISHKGTLKLLPIGKKNKQKLLIGDDSGQITCYEFKKGEPQVVFQARPFDSPISCVAIGGVGLKKDKIFISQGQRIIGLTKKGKEFYKLTSSLTEDINHIIIDETKIFTGCEYIMNVYDNSQEIAYFISNDVINSMLIDNITIETEFDVVLACQDNCIRIVHNSQLVIEVPTQSPVISIASFIYDDSKLNKGSPQLVYGLENGSLGLVRYDKSNYTTVWTIEDPSRSAISFICIFDVSNKYGKDVIVGRDDGRLQVYSFNPSYSIDSPPTIVFEFDLQESIRAIECGLVNSTEYNEIIVACYSGKLVSFTTEPVLQRAQDDTYGRSVQSINNENRIKYLRKEIVELKIKVDKEKEKLKRVSNSSVMKPPPDFPVISKFLLDTSLAAYVLTIELQNPVDIVIIRSPVYLDFLETGTSLISITPPELMLESNDNEEGSYKFVASFRGQTSDLKRINITIRSTEGEFGDLLVTVVSVISTNTKAAKVLRFPLKPLSLHVKCHLLTDEQLARPRNSIKFTGQLPMLTLHEWVQSLLPDIPPRLSENSIEETYFFKHTFTDSITICSFKKNEIKFESESASIVAIVKENVVNLANTRRVQIEDTLVTDKDSIKSFLHLIRNKLEYQISLARKMDLVEAVQEIAMQQDNSDNTSLSWLSAEYAEILKNQDLIRDEFKKRAKSLEYLSGIITDLYVDWNRLHSIDVKNKIPQLHE
eukprot:gene16891-22379_t